MSLHIQYLPRKQLQYCGSSQEQTISWWGGNNISKNDIEINKYAKLLSTDTFNTNLTGSIFMWDRYGIPIIHPEGSNGDH